MKSVSVLITITSVLITGYVAVAFTVETYEFGRDCTYFTKYLDEGDKLYVEYNGKNVGSSCDTFQFKGRGDDFWDEYKICLDQMYFNDSDCDVTLNIRSNDYSSVLDRTITCNLNADKEYCGSQNGIIYLAFRSTSSGWSRARFKFLVTAIKMYDYVPATSSSFQINLGPLLGSVIGGILLITIVLTVICRCVRRRVLRPAQVPGHAYNYVQYPSQPQQTNPYVITTTGASAPVSQPPIQQQTTVATNSEPPANEWSAPPPSYNVVTETSTIK